MAWVSARTALRELLKKCPPGVTQSNYHELIRSLDQPRPQETVTVRSDGVRFHKCESVMHEAPADFNRRAWATRGRMIKAAE